MNDKNFEDREEGRMLRQARDYEAKEREKIPKGQKPEFHFCCPVGWINDPNGFSCFDGEYHLFFQYHPYSTKWGPMHWGHAKTKDFIRWEFLPAALAPDREYDGQGCFSGSALEEETEEGKRQILLYTGVRETDENGVHRVFQTQCVAVGDGLDYVKSGHNPVILPDLLPEGSVRQEFRDPKIWKEGSQFFAILGNKTTEDCGQIALFSSEDVENWKFEGILDRGEKGQGKMWECPDFFSLDGSQVLITSPQFAEAKGLEFHNGNCTLYLVGRYDAKSHRFERTVSKVRAVDYGLDFYAPQTLLAPDGRRVMIAWMKNWDNDLTPDGFAWSGFMTIPRELSLKDGKLYQQPVRELERYYGKEVKSGEVFAEGGSFLYGRDPLSEEPGTDSVSGSKKVELPGIRGRLFDMTVEVKAGDYERFEIDLAADETHRTILYYEPKSGVLTFDRTWAGNQFRDSVTSRSCYVAQKDGAIRLRIVMDKYAAEIFVNDGEQAMSCLTYTDLTAEGIRFGAKGKAAFQVEWHELKEE